MASAGVPRWILNPLPLLEVIIGALTAVRLWVPVIPLVLAGLLMAFTGWILVAIRKDDVPTCACFGSMSKKPIGWRHVARNSVLIALAASARSFELRRYGDGLEEKCQSAGLVFPGRVATARPAMACTHLGLEQQRSIVGAHFP